MRQALKIACLAAVLASLTACATNNLGAPCQHYGQWCSKTPINTWKRNP